MLLCGVRRQERKTTEDFKEKNMDTEKAIRNWKWDWYAVHKHSGKYVLGFTNEAECREYCRKNGYSVRSFERTKKAKHKPEYIDSWTDDYSKDNVRGEIEDT